MAALAGMVCGAAAQQPVNQSGRMFEVNTQLGSGGYNYTRPTSPLIPGNAILQGNVGRGLSFQGFSPISSPTAFRAPLGSGSLGAFRRDSVSVADVASPYGGLTPRLYYDPSTTVYTPMYAGRPGLLPSSIGPLRAPVSPGASYSPAGTAALAGPLSFQLDTRLAPGAATPRDPLAAVRDLRTQIVGLPPGVAEPELASTIFGPQPALAPAPRSAAEEYYAKLGRIDLPEAQRTTAEATRDFGSATLTDPLGSRPPLGTPLEFVRRRDTGRFATPEDQAAEQPMEAALRRLGQPPEPLIPPTPAEDQPAATEEGGTPQLGPVQPPGELIQGHPRPRPLGELPQPVLGPIGEAPVVPAPPQPQPDIRDVSVLPGYDLFTDMQLALALSQNPNATWFSDMQAAIARNPETAQLLGDIAKMQADEFVAKLKETPIGSFHRPGDSAVNDELLKAESLMDIHQYYEAAQRYEVAHRLDPLNPLPLIGRGNAYLAAGDNQQALVSLLQGFERYPELSRFNFDLNALLGDPEVVDMRRARIMKQLEDRDDPKLRFLLGYIEYYSGNRESGLKNFERAAELDRTGSIIARMPAMLRGEGTLPPPKLPAVRPVTPPRTPAPGNPR